MQTLVVYDISDDDIRLKVSDACKRFGLTRIQRSTFMGYLTSMQRKELTAILRRVLDDADGNIQVFVICKADLALREVLGKPFEAYAKGDLLV
ncbi:CRISPR-associated endonuclease Cas2 [Candidatus Bathyarchaeota archaeon]|nr:CRISPR-associated endonuclease Cas2 [Candidatus Bathyarchaeota archaeon]MBS7618162.1 CRISPR-associated endonuclease Cas2 [Candidatus Bathyarchaeota archaeon]